MAWSGQYFDTARGLSAAPHLLGHATQVLALSACGSSDTAHLRSTLSFAHHVGGKRASGFGPGAVRLVGPWRVALAACTRNAVCVVLIVLSGKGRRDQAEAQCVCGDQRGLRWTAVDFSCEHRQQAGAVVSLHHRLCCAANPVGLDSDLRSLPREVSVESRTTAGYGGLAADIYSLPSYPGNLGGHT